ncbi:MAG: ShlB/FhaC/HecB family hemolysin secretion/activation protein [Methylococcales bacterium]|nr:ShlB/FhaC/HecB family hemolysin secretion/activation protein [Methylococcales bacterium]
MLKKIVFIWMVIFYLSSVCMAEPQSEIRLFIKKFSVQGQVPLSVEKIETIIRPYQNKSYDLGQLQTVAKALEQAIRTEGYAFYRVVLPPQTLKGHEITLKVISFALNKIEIKGTKYFDKTNILASLPALNVGKSPNMLKINNDLKMSNKHPFKEITLTFKQNENTPDTIDAQVILKAQRPYQALLMMNNTGTKRTGDFRMTAALQHSNLWNLDHQLSISYTTSPDHFKEVKQYGINYSLPLYSLKSWLKIYYAFSDVDNGIIANDFSVTGSGEMYGLKYQQLLPALGAYQHWLEVGIDNHFFMNDVKFLDTPIGNSVRSVPVSILYHGEYPWTYAKTNYHLQWLGNTGLGGHNDQESYQNSRFGAHKNWQLFRYGVNVSANFKQWALKLRLSGQYSGQTIISGEQFGIGGSRSVRGYAERETSADSGEILNLELYTPPWHGINLIGFYDVGHGRQHRVLVNEAKDWMLSSLGLGLRWQWKQTVFTSIDFAHTLDEGIQANGTHSGTNRIHANLMFRF